MQYHKDKYKSILKLWTAWIYSTGPLILLLLLSLWINTLYIPFVALGLELALFACVRYNRKKPEPGCYLLPFIVKRILFWSAIVMFVINGLHMRWIEHQIFDAASGNADYPYITILVIGPMATLNANYIKESLKDDFLLPIEGVCKHEFVFDGLKDKSTGVTTLNVAKRLLDYGFHAPTIYFPLLFHESMMIEPTETESLETLDEFIEVMHKVAKEARENPQAVIDAPLTTIVRKLDETSAAKNPILSYRDLKAEAVK